MRFGMILDVGFRILRRHWAVLLLLSLLFAGPAGLLSAATGLRVTEVALEIMPGFDEGVIDLETPIAEEDLSRAFDALGTYLLASVVAGVLTSIGALAFSAIVAADYHARKLGIGGALRSCLRRTPSALAVIIATTLIIVSVLLGGIVLILAAMALLPSTAGSGGPGIFLALIIVVAMVVAVVYLTMRWAPAFPAMINEDLGWRQALARAWHLSGDNVWRILGVLAFAMLATTAVSLLLTQLLAALLTGALVPLLGVDPLVTETVAMAAVAVLVAAIAPVLTAVLYFDLRTRRDVAEPAATGAEPLP